MNGLRWKWMGRVLTVTYVFLFGNSAVCRYFFRERSETCKCGCGADRRRNPSQIALTFDDGPSAAYTGKLLEGLKREECRPLFFIGENIEKEDNAL